MTIAAVLLVVSEEVGALDGSIKAEVGTNELDVAVSVKLESLARVVAEDSKISKTELMKLPESDGSAVVSLNAVIDTIVSELDGMLDVSLSSMTDCVVF